MANRPSIMRSQTPSSRIRVLLLVAAGVLGLAMLAGTARLGPLGLGTVLEVFVGQSFAGCAVFVWGRRPTNRLGPLMTAVGFLWLLGRTMTLVPNAVVYPMGLWLTDLWAAGFALFLLSVPTGRLTSRADDGMAIAHDLHVLLAASGNPGPYVLAGHSSGGVYVRFFAAAYPDEVAGVVLLDAQSPHATPVQPAGQAAQDPISTLSGILPALARIGIARLATSIGSSDLPADVEARRHAAESTPQGVASFGDEFARLDSILDAAAALPDLGDRPLALVTAAAEPLDGWLAQQDHLATLSTNVSHRVFPDLTHVSLIESPKGATAASDAIVAVVSSVRSGTRLGAPAAARR